MATFDRFRRGADASGSRGPATESRETLARIVTALTQLATSERVAEAAAEAVLTVGRGEWAVLMAVGEDKYATRAVAGQNVGSTYGPLSDDPVWSSVLGGSIQVVADPDRLSEEGRRAIGSGTWRSLALVPVSVGGGVRFVVLTGRSTADARWAQETAHLLSAYLAEPVGAALAREERMRRLEAAAEIDPLTGVANAQAWQRRLPVELARVTRMQAPLTVLAIVPREITEESLAERLAERMSLADFAAAVVGVVREDDVVARTAPTRLMASLAACDERQARAVVRRLQRVVPPGWTCAIAAVTWNGMESAAELQQRVEQALYLAQRPGTREPVFFGT